LPICIAIQMQVIAAKTPAVNARSMTAGMLVANTQNQASRSSPHLVWNALGCAFKKLWVNAGASSTTNSKAHAASIQLNSNGITEVDGALVKGLSHGNVKHTTRSKRLASKCGLLKICMVRFS